MTYKTIEEWIERNPNHVGMLPIEVCRQIWGTKKKEWVGLTKEEAREICVKNVPYVVDMVAALEAKLKEKNNG